MATEGIGKLEAWEDRPRRNPSADLIAAGLDPRRAFLLTRIDGTMSVTGICDISGMTERETLEALGDLVARGIVLIDPAPGRRTPIQGSIPEPPSEPTEPASATDRSAASQGSLRSASRMPEVEEPPPVMEQIENLPDFHGVAPADVEFLRAKGDLWRIPGMPWRRPGDTDRYGRYQFDQEKLRQHCDLLVIQRRDVLFLHEVGPQMDHFEYFALEPTADRAEWRRAYFRFTRQFHPDAFFRKDMGIFKPMLEAIYRRGTLIHDTVAAEEELRERYCRAVIARNEAYVRRLHEARARYEAALRAIQARKDARAQEAAQRAAAKAKEAITARLQANREARRDRVNPANERVEQAARFYEEARKLYAAQNFLGAASAAQMAKTYDPAKEEYAQFFARVSEKANALRAEQTWKMGYMQESVGRMEEALTTYLEAVRLHPRPDYCLRCAELMFTLDQDLHKAAELARIASDADPQNVEYLLLLGRIYERVNLMVKAAGVLEKALKLAPKDERIKKALKGLKK